MHWQQLGVQYLAPPSILCHADLRTQGLNHQPFNLIVLPHEPQLLPPVFPNLGLSFPRFFTLVIMKQHIGSFKVL